MVNFFKYNHDEPFKLEKGEFLPSFELAYSTYGTLNKDKSNVIWVCHAFTGNANPADWWSGLIGSNRHYNPEEHYIICANIIGSSYGSTQPLSVNPETKEPFYHSFPFITNRDVINSFVLLRKHLGIKKINTLLGGSLGGQHALEWAVMEPNTIENLVLLSTNAIHSPWGIAFNESQRMAIEGDPTFKERNAKAGLEGLKVARSIALLSYRNYFTYNRTQSRSEEQTDFFRANTYQKYQGEKILKRFNAFAYYTLTKMFDSHDVGRSRGGVIEALKSVVAKTLVIGITSDVLFPIEEQKFIADNINGCTFVEIDSTYGHDGFLIEFEKLTDSIVNWKQKCL